MREKFRVVNICMPKKRAKILHSFGIFCFLLVRRKQLSPLELEVQVLLLSLQLITFSSVFSDPEIFRHYDNLFLV